MDNLTPITREEMLMNDEPLTPITREEKILAGEDLTPVTRREYFLKKYRHAGGDVMVDGLSVTENGTYTAPEGKAYSPVEVAVPLPENAYLLKTASGSLVSFSDGADLPMPSFICNIDAVQDLHGYDSPWVGGAGKNKINLADITTTSVGFVYNREPINVVANTYTLSFNFTGGSGSISISLRNGETVVSTIQDRPLVNGLNTYTMPTLSDNADSISLYTGISGTYENFMLEVGSQATTFAPYENICPISGWSAVDVTIQDDIDNPTTTETITIQLGDTYYGGKVDLVSGVLTVDRGMLTLNGSEAYYSIQSSSADDNTVLRVATGHVCNQNENQKSNYGTYNNNAWQRLASRVNTFVLGSEGNLYLQIPSSTASTVEEFKALFASNPLQVCYELTTPITIQLTPTQVKSLLGTNNAWCDTGDIEIDYFAKEV